MFQDQNFYTYVFALTIAAVIPGPGMITLLINTIKDNKAHGWITLTGLVLGDFIYLTLSMIFILFLNEYLDSQIIQILIILGGLYLGYMAFQLWISDHLELRTHPTSIQQITRKKYFVSFTQGFLVTLSNPKTMTFYIAVLPALIQTQVNLQLNQITNIYISTILILFIIGAIYIHLAILIMNYLNSEKWMNIIIKILSLTLGSIALGLIYSQF